MVLVSLPWIPKGMQCDTKVVCLGSCMVPRTDKPKTYAQNGEYVYE